MTTATDGSEHGANPGAESRRAPALPSNYLRACLQLLLLEGSAHGYELGERVAGLGLDSADRGAIYRVLRSMEDERLVRSWWEEGVGTPPKRTYEMTEKGFEELCRGADSLREAHLHIGGFLARFHAFDDPGRGVAA